MKQKKNTIYLDAHASTMIDPTVLNAMLPFFTEHYGNGDHQFGWKTTAALEEARFYVARLLAAKPTEIIFTSGATEAINMGILGLAQSNQSNRNHIITQRTEHPAVLKSVEELKRRGYRISVLNVDKVGRIDLDELEKLVDKKTLVVAIMLANNEIGTIQPIEEIGKICRNSGAKFFCDLTQGIGWHDVDVNKLNIDMASLSAHKIYGPRGVGALYVRKHQTRIKLDPINYGGGQEGGLRSGTSNIPGIVGLGQACKILFGQAEINFYKIRKLRDRLQQVLFSNLKDVKLNGCPYQRHPGNLNMAIPHVSGEDLIGALPEIIFSTGSACSSGSAKPSNVITAIDNNPEVLKNSFRFGLCKYNTKDEIDVVAQKIIKIAKQLQSKRIHKFKLHYTH